MSREDHRTVPWSSGVWTSPPESSALSPLGLSVEAAQWSDAWNDVRTGEKSWTANALVTELRPGEAMEVAFIADMTEQFDQAGIFIVVDEDTWAKAGVELSEGLLQLSATVTYDWSDRSMCRITDWNGRPVRVRVSWRDNALMVFASVDGDPFHLMRLFPLSEDQAVRAGPYLASPHRLGLSITFTDWLINDADDVVA